eukprot:7903616-Pyramimonas_sp.AAC.2
MGGAGMRRMGVAGLPWRARGGRRRGAPGGVHDGQPMEGVRQPPRWLAGYVHPVSISDLLLPGVLTRYGSTQTYIRCPQRIGGRIEFSSDKVAR